MRQVRSQSLGFTLLEIMIGLTISLLLMSFLLTTYLSAQHAYQLQINLKHIQDNANTIIAILTEEIQKSGYIGCAYLTKDFPVISHVTETLKNSLIINHDNELLVKYMDFPGATLLFPVTNQQIIYTTNEIVFSKDEKLIISDCHAVEIMQIASIREKKTEQEITFNQSIINPFLTHAEIGKLIINKFYVAKTNRKHPDGSSVYALYMEDIQQQKSELVEDITSMKIFYSVLQNDKLVDVSALTDLNQENLVGISLKLSLVAGSLKKNWYAYIPLRAYS